MFMYKYKSAREGRLSKAMKGLWFPPACKVTRCLPQSPGCWQKTWEVRDRGLLRQHELPVHIASPTPPNPKGRCRAAQVTAAPRLGLERSWKPSSSTIVLFLDYVCLLPFHSFKEAVSQPALALPLRETLSLLSWGKKQICSLPPGETASVFQGCLLMQVPYRLCGNSMDNCLPTKRVNIKLNTSFSLN